MEEIIINENWQMDLGDGYLYEEPYFNSINGFYHYIDENQIPLIQYGYQRIDILEGRLVVLYGLNFNLWYGRRV